MDKLLVTFFSLLIIVSCNNKNKIPENSIYQEGDVVFKIDKVEDNAVNFEVIFRSRTQQLILINNTEGKNGFSGIIEIKHNVKYHGMTGDIYMTEDEKDYYFICLCIINSYCISYCYIYKS